MEAASGPKVADIKNRDASSGVGFAGGGGGGGGGGDAGGTSPLGGTEGISMSSSVLTLQAAKLTLMSAAIATRSKYCRLRIIVPNMLSAF